MLHTNRVYLALRGNALRQLRIALGFKARPKAPVLEQCLENVVSHHAKVCEDYLKLLPSSKLTGQSVCEIGPGDCLAAAALFLGLGAKAVDLVELNPPVVNEKQIQTLEALSVRGFPLDSGIIRCNPNPELDADRVRYHTQYVEDYVSLEPHDWIVSHDVFEHVEDLKSSFLACFQALKPGGHMVHFVDLGGHGQFEDPLPPLDFQTYGDLVYGWMYPKFHRATRRFVSEYVSELCAAGFVDVTVTPLRTADPAYVSQIFPRLRPAARLRDKDELGVIEFALIGRKAS